MLSQLTGTPYGQGKKDKLLTLWGDRTLQVPPKKTKMIERYSFKSIVRLWQAMRSPVPTALHSYVESSYKALLHNTNTNHHPPLHSSSYPKSCKPRAQTENLQAYADHLGLPSECVLWCASVTCGVTKGDVAGLLMVY